MVTFTFVWTSCLVLYSKCCTFSYHNLVKLHLRLRLELTGQDLNTAKPRLGLEPTVFCLRSHLISGLSEAQILDVSFQKEFREKQSDR